MGFLSGSAGHMLFGRQVDLDEDDASSADWIKTDTKITNWTLTTTAQLLDTTTLGDYDKTSVYGLRTHTGTFRLLYYTMPGFSPAAVASPQSNSASWFINALIRAELEDEAKYLPPIEPNIESIPVRLRLYLQFIGLNPDVVANHDYIDVNANITSLSFGSNVGELTALDATFESKGRIVRSRV